MLTIKYESEYLAEFYNSDYCIPVEIIANVTVRKDIKYDTPLGSHVVEFLTLESIESIISSEVRGDLMALYKTNQRFNKEVSDEINERLERV